jgi:hypothetical protein
MTAQSMPAMTGAVAPAAFDYGQLDPALIGELHERVERIRAYEKKQNEAVFFIGEELLTAKRQLKHGQFLAWLAAEFRMSADTAERYMNVATHLAGKIRTLRNLDLTTLYLLSAKSTPEEVRKEIVDGLVTGEAVTDTEIKRRIAAARTDSKGGEQPAHKPRPAAPAPAQTEERLPVNPEPAPPPPAQAPQDTTLAARLAQQIDNGVELIELTAEIASTPRGRLSLTNEARCAFIERLAVEIDVRQKRFWCAVELKRALEGHDPEASPKRPRGRPKGSLNKPKQPQPVDRPPEAASEVVPDVRHSTEVEEPF